MKRPKKTIIGGKEWRIVYNKNPGGCFDGSKYLIKIGTLYSKDIPAILLHEIVEAILTERSHRYRLYNDCEYQNYLFSLNHDEFTNFIMDLALALKDIIK